MTIFRAPLANDKGEVMLSMQASGVVPAGATEFRGLWVTINGLIGATNDTGQARKYVGGFALEDPSGLLLVTETAPVSVPMDGINANVAGAVVTKTGAGSLIHQGVAMTVSAPGGPIVVNKDEPPLTFYASLERGINSAKIEGVGTRDSQATYWAEDGTLRIAEVNEIRQEFQNGQPLGTLMEPASTNQVPNYNANPDEALTGLFKTGDAAAVMTRAQDTEKLRNVGLDRICTSGYGVKLDNVAGSADALIQCQLALANTNVHSVSAWARNDSSNLGNCTIRISGTGGVSVQVTSDEYARYSDSGSPDAVGRVWEFVVPAGNVGYFILNQLEEQTVPTSVIVTEGAAASRAVDQLQWPLVGVPYGSELSDPNLDEPGKWVLDAEVSIDGPDIVFTNTTALRGAYFDEPNVPIVNNGVYEVSVNTVEAPTLTPKITLYDAAGNFGQAQFDLGEQTRFINVNTPGGSHNNTIGVQLDPGASARVRNVRVRKVSFILNQTEGMAAITFRPGFAGTDFTTGQYRILRLGTDTSEFMYYTPTGPEAFWNWDGTNLSNAPIAAGLQKDQLDLIALRWEGVTKQIGFKTGGTWVWSTSGSYDGNFNEAGTLDLVPEATTIKAPSHSRELYLWSEDKGTAWLESFFSGVAN